MSLWRLLSLRSWPSFVIVGPEGQVVFSAQGEGRREILDLAICCTLDYYRKKGREGLLNENPVPIELETPVLSESIFSYPGKLHLHEESRTLFISDTNNHRIVIARFNTNGEKVAAYVIASIGRQGRRGFKDGGAARSRFNRPQGLAFDSGGKVLYVADTENHAIRAIHFSEFPEVSIDTIETKTIVGSGEQLQNYSAESREDGTVGLSSPWDVLFVPDVKRPSLYIAMAGTHQIWRLDTKKLTCSVLAGTGQEKRQDTTETDKACFAQPSGLALHPQRAGVFVADSESSSIRYVRLKTGETSTFVGGGTDPDDLFLYGDTDGQGSAARLQHPLAMECLPEKRDGLVSQLGPDEYDCIICDTYNHKLKLAKWSSSDVVNWKLKFAEKGDRLSEPSGLALALDHKLLFVADTNNSLIRAVNLHTGVLSTVTFTQQTKEHVVSPPAPPILGAPAKPLFDRNRSKALPSASIEVGGRSEVHITGALGLTLCPAGFNLTL